MTEHKDNHIGHVVFFVLALLLGATFGYYVGAHMQESTTIEDQAAAVDTAPEKTPAAAATKTPAATTTPATSKTYTNATYGFSFNYPSDWTINEVEVAKNPQLLEPWKSFIAYTDFTPPKGQDHYGYVGVSAKTIDQLIPLISGDTVKKETTTFASTSATKVSATTTAGDTNVVYYIVKGGYTYVISGAQTTSIASEKANWTAIKVFDTSFAFTK